MGFFGDLFYAITGQGWGCQACIVNECPRWYGYTELQTEHDKSCPLYRGSEAEASDKRFWELVNKIEEKNKGMKHD